MGLELSGDGAVSNGGVEAGDIIWLAQRKKVAEVGYFCSLRCEGVGVEGIRRRASCVMRHTPWSRGSQAVVCSNGLSASWRAPYDQGSSPGWRMLKPPAYANTTTLSLSPARKKEKLTPGRMDKPRSPPRANSRTPL